ncbi:hypothetical protein EL45_03985 [Cellulophaga sp. E6(2014)]|jgi:hypothetical protein|nr:hypothetical protein EL45_03985 [Cellulophaga sp. E6(2014)]
MVGNKKNRHQSEMVKNQILKNKIKYILPRKKYKKDWTSLNLTISNEKNQQSNMVVCGNNKYTYSKTGKQNTKIAKNRFSFNNFLCGIFNRELFCHKYIP